MNLYSGAVHLLYMCMSTSNCIDYALTTQTNHSHDYPSPAQCLIACYSTTPPHTSTPQLLACHPRTFDHLHAPRNEPIWLDKTFERDFLTVSELYSPVIMRQSSQTDLSTKGSNLEARNISAHGTHHFRPHLDDARQPPRVSNSLWCLANTTNMWGGVDARCLVP